MKTAKKRPRRTAEVGAVYTFREGDRFGACQVLRVAEKRGADEAEIATLDWLAERPPTPTDELAIMRQDWGFWNGQPARTNVEAQVPWWAEHAFTTKVLETFRDACESYGGWHTARGAFHRDAWNRRTPRVKIDPKTVDVDIGGGARALRRDTDRVTIAADDSFALVLPTKGKPRLAALDVLPNLAQVTFHGPSAELAGWTKARRLEGLTWMDHGLRELDLSRTSLEEITVGIDGDVVLRLPPTLRALTLIGDSTRVTLEELDGRYPFSLTLVGPRMAAPRGARDIECVRFEGIVDGGTAALAAFPKLKELGLRGKPGVLDDSEGFAALGALRELAVHQVYGLDAARFPTAWPTLDAVEIHGIEKGEADVLKRAFAEVPTVRITGARTKAWMEVNLGNPFRDWEEANQVFGRAACAAWRKAKTATTKLGPKAKPKAVEAVLKAFVTTLNRIDGDGRIDTIRREEAAEVFFALAADCGIDAATAEGWFDAWRDF